jgi:hypothetical protein
VPRNLAALRDYQVFLNYPFDEAFAAFDNALHFAIVAANLLPVCAKDLTVPDRPRLDALVDAIRSCGYSAHDFSRLHGYGAENLARLNMPLETGMALFHALATQRHEHRCSFFVPEPFDHQRAASDLAGLDPRCYNNDPRQLVGAVYEWLRDVVPAGTFNAVATIEVVARFDAFIARLLLLRGSGVGGSPTHNEAQEVMYEMCATAGWWEWRQTRVGLQQFPRIPLVWHENATIE